MRILFALSGFHRFDRGAEVALISLAQELVRLGQDVIPSKRVRAGIVAVNKVAGAHLVVAGDGPLRDEIDQTAARLLPGRYTRLSVAPQEMPSLYQSADVFLHLSEEESFGNVFLEAMACGLPIVGNDSSRLRWIVGDDEYLLNSDNSDDVSEKLLAAWKENQSKERRLARAKSFSWKQIAKTYLNFFQEVVSNTGTGIH
jgi:glycosyltransferase involved in cell wall biosynthesis